MSNEEPAGTRDKQAEEQGTDAGPIERTDASGDTAEEQGTDEGAIEQP
jgi:hypothetical protein